MATSTLPSQLSSQDSSLHRHPATIGDLPHDKRLSALDGATYDAARTLGMPACRRIPFEASVHVAFGLSKAQAKAHIHSKLLLTRGRDLTL